MGNEFGRWMLALSMAISQIVSLLLEVSCEVAEVSLDLGEGRCVDHDLTSQLIERFKASCFTDDEAAFAVFDLCSRQPVILVWLVDRDFSAELTAAVKFGSEADLGVITKSFEAGG